MPRLTLCPGVILAIGARLRAAAHVGCAAAEPELTVVLEVMVRKSASGSGQPSVFSEITDDDIDNLFND